MLCVRRRRRRRGEGEGLGRAGRACAWEKKGEEKEAVGWAWRGKKKRKNERVGRAWIGEEEEKEEVKEKTITANLIKLNEPKDINILEGKEGKQEEEYKSKTGFIKEYGIYGFALFCVVLIILLLIKNKSLLRLFFIKNRA